MNKILMVLFVCELPTNIYANEIKIYKLDLTYQKLWHNSEPLLPEIKHKNWGDAVSFESGVSVNNWYLDTNFHFESAYGKVMTAGLLFSTGYQLNKYISLEYGHHSFHSLDTVNSYATEEDKKQKISTTAYKLQDKYGIRISFIPDERKNK